MCHLQIQGMTEQVVCFLILCFLVAGSVIASYVKHKQEELDQVGICGACEHVIVHDDPIIM